MSKSVAFVACVIGSFVVACGGESTGPESGGTREPETRVPAVAGTGTVAPPAATSPPAAPSTPPPVSTGPSTPSGASSSGGGPDQCEPDAACGGLSQCVDSCYTERCCYLGCACNTNTGRLECGLRCGG